MIFLTGRYGKIYKQTNGIGPFTEWITTGLPMAYLKSITVFNGSVYVGSKDKGVYKDTLGDGAFSTCKY